MKHGERTEGSLTGAMLAELTARQVGADLHKKLYAANTSRVVCSSPHQLMHNLVERGQVEVMNEACKTYNTRSNGLSYCRFASYFTKNSYL